MGFFSDFFRSGENPSATWGDGILGPTIWKEEDEAWHGSFNGCEFALSYEGIREPSHRVVEYAREVLGDPEWIEKVLEDEKGRARDEYRGDLSAEIGNLRIAAIWFGLQRGELVATVQLAGGRDGERAWRMDFAGEKCSGIGFDS